jgi:hypothetical protein
MRIWILCVSFTTGLTRFWIMVVVGDKTEMSIKTHIRTILHVPAMGVHKAKQLKDK